MMPGIGINYTMMPGIGINYTMMPGIGINYTMMPGIGITLPGMVSQNYYTVYVHCCLTVNKYYV
jgi:hypothetical protein